MAAHIQYTHVIKSIEKFVSKEHSEQTWKEILEKSGFQENEQLYGQDVVINQEVFEEMANHTTDILGIEHNTLMEGSGRCLLDFYLESGYETIIRSIGPDLPTLISGLDHLHEHFNYRFPGMRPPSFRVTYDTTTNNTFYVHYYTERVGLDYYVIGLLRALGKRIFDQNVKITLKQSGRRHHDSSIFIVKLPTNIDSRTDRLSSIIDVDLTSDLESVIDQETFNSTFPFHILLDRHLNIIQAGIALVRIIKTLKPGQSNFLDFFTVVRPDVELTFNGIMTHINSIYHVETVTSHHKKSFLTEGIDDMDGKPIDTLRLKGQMMYLSESETFMFFASPRVFSLDGLSEKGMYLSDIPIHDATRDLILLSEQHSAENKLKEKLEELTDQLQKTSKELEYEQRLADRLLYDILPPSVADDLRAKKQVAAKKYELVTILFSGIADFGSLCNDSADAMEIVTTLNSIYIHFDKVSDKNTEIYKVETVGDKYMCVSGLPIKSNLHAHNIAHLALDMMKISKDVKVGDKNIVITIGIHSGEVVAGVIGKRLPRYCLFGNCVNLTSRTETTGVKGKINVSEVTYEVLNRDPDPEFHFECRGPVTMKGKKEPMITYFLTSNNETNHSGDTIANGQCDP
ncbi:guanylate cyclase soluble subunit beta-1-like isoform X3 [Clytia hemisphaerica]|uniref:Guanylate cyclase soluble subunit beta-1 n=1 Tax=Clytia hemisphaerica TaxID=252671 RepID=A0A7M5WT40_9CNID